MPPREADGPGGGLVRAAGCVLWRRAPGAPGGVEIALVHRPKYDDWSHPKGKLEAGETPEAAALREVAEETGMTCRLVTPLTTARYLVRGRPKEVSYWSAQATGGAFRPSDEIDALVWLPPPAARARLTHPADRALLDEALSTV
ncbi:NUDIX hydrolase [Streptomyces sp. 7-21]|uniref:NUDIX hydrolase n=1 Tax=Streptomyces sp. 7-21 TaxID=2802283 RepID=UPI00191EC11F|nr:NUDIX hydrolase [Streptomyces sp. 7-21]MBL1068556.1 NUDIX hydrolase [Streptomyces sp. 7-21]